MEVRGGQQKGNKGDLEMCAGGGGVPGEELGWCRVLGERLREPRVSELGAGGWCRWGSPMSGACWWRRVCEGGRGASAEGCLGRNLGGVGCWARGLESRE